MRRLTFLLALLPLTALAQMPGQLPPQQGDGPLPYSYKKNQLPPAVLYEQDQGGIPTSGTDQAKNLDMNKPGYRRGGPTIINRTYDKKGSTAVISGPNGTTVCTDRYGRRSTSTVCY